MFAGAFMWQVFNHQHHQEEQEKFKPYNIFTSSGVILWLDFLYFFTLWVQPSLSSSPSCHQHCIALWSYQHCGHFALLPYHIKNGSILHYNHIMKIVVVLHYNHFIGILAIIMIKTFRWFCNSGFFWCFSHRHQNIATPPLIKDNHWNLTKDNH